ncbi:hypothetical protein D0869_04945 [Hortaea werneckii]|uniref:Uncharacterized protein n=1 Tax=Hortaea werneckii TaxID=91943 RepID=A0A3M6ZXH0_HORWE|nr:hypothetical protein D0869_04945 [Hortaea werneckii]RMY19739.1 hypothetical protein D0867_04507 [Hortaea werneckii]
MRYEWTRNMATAAGLMLSALGLTTSLISLGTSNLPEPNASIPNGGRAICSYSDDSSIRVAVGLHGRDDPYNYKGSVDLRLYTTYGEVIGYPEVDKSINAGNRVYEVTPYVKVTGNNDAICINWLTVSWPGNDDWVFSGGFAERCNIAPCPSVAKYYNDDGSGLTYFSPPPDIDNGSNLGKRGSDEYPQPDTDRRQEGSLLGSIGRLLVQNNTRLIQSDLPEHSASRVCDSDSSWGPSFISTGEGTFCDMSSKILYPVCGGEKDTGEVQCFDLVTRALKGLNTLSTFEWLSFERWTGNILDGTVSERVLE